MLSSNIIPIIILIKNIIYNMEMEGNFKEKLKLDLYTTISSYTKEIIILIDSCWKY